MKATLRKVSGFIAVKYHAVIRWVIRGFVREFEAYALTLEARLDSDQTFLARRLLDTEDVVARKLSELEADLKSKIDAANKRVEEVETQALLDLKNVESELHGTISTKITGVESAVSAGSAALETRIQKFNRAIGVHKI